MKTFIKKLDKILFLNLLENLYRKYLLNNSTKFLKNYPNKKEFTNNLNKNLFSILCKKYGTDKSNLTNLKTNKNGHFYASYYHQLFKSKRNKVKLILECGIGSTDEKIPSNMTKNGKPGASLRVLRDYFKNAKIHGADIDKRILINNGRIKSYYVDQLNIKSINKMWKKINKNNFDIIIDDGMHDLTASLNFFNHSFSKLKKGGFYIIEDVNISYLITLANKLKKFNPKIIFSKKINNIDDYLFIIKKIN